jgi:ribose transport system substrate-binding protein
MPDGGVVAIFVGHLNALNAQERRQGVVDELAGKKDASGEEVQVGGAKFMQFGKYRQYGAPALLDMPEKETKALANAQDALTTLQGEKQVCLVGLWAYEPPALLTAAENPGKIESVKIVAFDEASRTLDGVADGRIAGTIVQNPYQFGYKSVKIMAALAKGEDKTKAGIPADGVLYEPFRIVTKERGVAYPESVHGEKSSMGVKEFREELEKLKK